MIQKLPVAETCNLFVIKNEITVDDPFNRKVERDEFICERHYNGTVLSLYPREPAPLMEDKPDIIGKYLKGISVAFPSHKTALFTWDHGSVFGINKKQTSVHKAFKAFDTETSGFNEGADFYINPVIFRASHSVEKDNVLIDILSKINNPSKWLKEYIGKSEKIIDANNPEQPVIDMLTNEMLGKAIELGGFNSAKKLDVVCMMNCCMQNLHAQYALQEYVRFLVAPVTWIYFPGYDYSSIFAGVFRTPEMDSKELAALIVKTCELDANKPVPVVHKAHNEGIFAINLENIRSVATLLKKNMAYEVAQLKAVPAHKSYLYGLCHNPFREFEETDIINYRLIDLYQLYRFRTDRYSPEFPDWQKRYSTGAYRLFNRGIISKFIGKNVLTISGHEITGMAMSLPNSRTYLDPQQLFVKLYYKPSRYQSALIEFLKLDDLMNAIYT